MKIFLCGDVMRGIDQALPYPCFPMLHEGYVEFGRRLRASR